MGAVTVTRPNPSARTRSAMRGCGTKVGVAAMLERATLSKSSHRLSRPSLLVSVKASISPARHAAAMVSEVAVRLVAPVALDVIDLRPAFGECFSEQLPAAAAAINHDPFALHVGELGQREQTLAVHGRRRSAHLVDAGCGKRRCRSGPGRERNEMRRPRRGISDAVFDRRWR